MLKKAMSNLDKSLLWITRFAHLNALFLLYSLLGLVVAGAAPATVAALQVSRRFLNGEEVKVHQAFRKAFKQEFWSANKLGWLLGAAGFILYTNYLLIRQADGQLFFLVPFLFYVLIFCYMTVVLWSFPLLANYKSGTFQVIRSAFIIGLTRFHMTLSIGVLLFALLYHSIGLPVLLLFFCFSISAFGWMWLSMKVFSTMKHEEQLAS
ncbi:YesL family protein [Terribacillus saccharophilus]|uniref:DUF624 domain-containing protein n=1 Tax=Terribacillus saccharophilus TaxID=361277 RepID=A0A268AB87_9BACI|nr:DUF624 domain-containing protein [Terribacillus saccharophilus]PAD21384.1 hypothetical protein CHH64_08735 [Terribacillus saccharophilus]PAF16830.1 hypothetical protein CHH51_15310 [Terribacillus saccharophilus]PAF20907.1 hypothetical protein CHH49_12705 [Terribacillus saccharophilus]PAF34712.1 hypothetical protein CHH69_14380 [Terribacillus saccharophilus]PAF36284.1 hypothetical protein CHH58_12800 [Terribacillus saccharophilus]